MIYSASDYATKLEDLGLDLKESLLRINPIFNSDLKDAEKTLSRMQKTITKLQELL